MLLKSIQGKFYNTTLELSRSYRLSRLSMKYWYCDVTGKFDNNNVKRESMSFVFSW